MAKIRVLPDILASQVAAGEVVERPASVVKELVENSVDAGAREVRIDVDKGGALLIRVADDGCGMNREDALLSLERHATSKLRTAAGLAAITTLGFRGEAVPSIASVSRFRMITREQDAVCGTELIVDGGVVRDVREAGCAPGTTIEARALFFNMPARRKFLRAETTEAAHIEHQLRLHALAAPSVRFRFRKDDREVFDLPAVARPIDRVRQFLGVELAGELVSLGRTSGSGITVEGFVLPARHARRGRRHQCVFLNGRPIEDAAVSRGLTEGFRGAISDGLHPSAWLWIEMDPVLVDVNVHPAKREVRFHRPLELKDAIAGALAAALRSPAPANPPAAPTAARPLHHAFRPAQPSLAEWKPTPEPGFTGPPPQPDDPPAAPKTNAPNFRTIGILLDRYVILESTEGLVLFDPRAAHERILYEQLLHAPAEAAAQGLLVPVTLELDPRDHDLVLRERGALEDAGVEVGDFGGRSVQIHSLPACIRADDPRAFIGGLLDELLHSGAPGPRFAAERIVRLLARRAAFPIVPRLAEIPALLEKLFACELPYCAADGRPTLTEYSLKEISRRLSNS
ncbi:MAG: DNA mismatch repair endonuclease MutL [Verrucomicrobiota bacterium]